MDVSVGVRGPFPFGPDDLEAGRLNAGVAHTLADFRRWRDAHPDRVAAHVDRYSAHVAEIRAGHRLPARAIRLPARPIRLPAGPIRRWRRAEHVRAAREIVHFGALNMGELLPPATVEAIAAGARDRVAGPGDVLADIDPGGGAAGVVAALERRLPAIRGTTETRWLAGRLDRLHHTLPEAVVRAGSMGKVVRAMVGVLVIGAYDTLDADPAEATAHLTRIIPAAYAFGAAYAIFDDTLLDLPGGAIPAGQRRRYGEMVSRALATGKPADVADVPDHPLAEEAHELHALLLESYPFDGYRHLYQAAEAMYLAQQRDAELPARAGLAARYPDALIKAGMSRVVANVLGRRALPEGFYARCVNTIFVSQLRDDLIDRREDARAGRVTPFTVPPEHADANPLYDLFAYNAYVAGEVFGGDPAATDALSAYDAARLAGHLAADPEHAADLVGRYDTTPEIARFLRVAAGLPRRVARGLDAADQRLKRRVGQALSHREPTAVDCRTFVADRIGYVNEVLARHCPPPVPGDLSEIVAYAMGGSGKRLRPALALMLAAGLGVDPADIEPVLAAGELFHTASLIFDDLPAQDDATVRRGRPAAHKVFDEGSVQLAALSMVSSGFGLIAQLDRRFPAHRVTEVTGYLGSVLGPERLCRGQHLDLRMGRDGTPTGPEILAMYELKTSTAIEAALVPLMMVLDRPAGEIELVRRYAHHAGIVFQLRDDILDATSATGVLGKDAGNDVGKANIVRVYGLAEARRLMGDHLAEAVDCCARLPFDTGLLVGMVRHFATRRR